MPSYIMHLAVAKIYLKYHREEDKEEFIRGVIAPDLLEKPRSHYGEATSSPNLEMAKSINGLKSGYDRGYYLHLKTDKLFYQELLNMDNFLEEIYEDYNRINQSLIRRYELVIPEEIKEYVEFWDGETKKLHEYMAVGFIDAVGKLELEELSEPGEILYRIGRSVFWKYENCVGYHRDSNLDVAGLWLKKAAEKNHVKGMVLLAVLYMWYGYEWEDIQMDCGEPHPFAQYTDDANTQAEKWLLRAAEMKSAEAMYLLGNLYKKPFGCSCGDDWFPGKVPEHWNERTAKKWMKKAMESGCLFGEKTGRPEIIQWLLK